MPGSVLEHGDYKDIKASRGRTLIELGTHTHTHTTL